MRTPRSSPVTRRCLAWLVWLGLLLPVAQFGAVAHSLAHARSEQSRDADGKQAPRAAHCDLCLLGAAVGSGAPFAQVDAADASGRHVRHAAGRSCPGPGDGARRIPTGAALLPTLRADRCRCAPVRHCRRTPSDVSVRSHHAQARAGDPRVGDGYAIRRMRRHPRGRRRAAPGDGRHARRLRGAPAGARAAPASRRGRARGACCCATPAVAATAVAARARRRLRHLRRRHRRHRGARCRAAAAVAATAPAPRRRRPRDRRHRRRQRLQSGDVADPVGPLHAHLAATRRTTRSRGFPLPPDAEIGPGTRGFSLGESELGFAASIDPWLRGAANIALDGRQHASRSRRPTCRRPRSATASSLKAGRFFSGIGYLNPQHAHTWDFVDNPLAYQAMLGTQYGDDGVQLSWLAPIDQYLELGAEARPRPQLPGQRHAAATAPA